MSYFTPDVVANGQVPGGWSTSTTAPPTPTLGKTYGGGVPIPKPTFPVHLLKLVKNYLESKLQR